MSGNTYGGINIQGSSSNIVIGNFIGTDASGTVAVPNRREGVDILYDGVYAGGTSDRIGGTTIGEGNVISGNQANGIFIDGSISQGNLVQGNFIGFDITGLAALDNRGSGVYIAGTLVNFIGTDATGTPVVGSRNVIAANGNDGVTVEKSNNTIVAGNWTGTDANGLVAFGNADSGVYVLNSDGVRIGPPVEFKGVGLDSVLSGNKKAGVTLDGATHTQVFGNIIGSDRSGNLQLGNLIGVKILNASADNVIGFVPNKIL